jgi:hypothetical protein
VIAKRRQTGIAPSESGDANGPAAPADDEQPAEKATA